jgi:4'-phosphopantetheinyl transferase
MDADTMLAPQPGAITLGPGDVHAWIVDLDSPGGGLGVLDPAERDRAASYLRPADGAGFAAGRAAARTILSGYVGCAPERLRFRTGSHGQPRLAGYRLSFSMARSDALALFAVASDPVGADLELLRPRPALTDLAAATFGAPELACIAARCAGSPVRGFYRHWTAKEAYLKAVGCGLAGLRDAELVCGRASFIRFRGEAQPGWQLTLADPAAGYVAAIAAAARVTSWRWLAG